ncbi:hypothetical protein LP420_23245 [Massilia sp. B-10]|nr:hypothetical protein LP420_23245 [Massilia sp. B-10]
MGNGSQGVVYLGVVATAAIISLQTWGQRHSTANEAAVMYAFELSRGRFLRLFLAGRDDDRARLDRRGIVDLRYDSQSMELRAAAWKARSSPSKNAAACHLPNSPALPKKHPCGCC